MQHTNKPVSTEKMKSINAAYANVSRVVAETIRTTLDGVRREVSARAYRASNELRNASLIVLRGQRSGRVYKVPGTHGDSKNSKKMLKEYGHALRGGVLYRASAPGEPPAVRTGLFRLSWAMHIHVEKSGKDYYAISSIESGLRVGKYLLGDLLEDGTPRMAARPYKQAVRDRAMPKIRALYDRPWRV